MCNIIIKGKTPFEKAKSFITQYSTYTALPAEEKEKFNDYLNLLIIYSDKLIAKLDNKEAIAFIEGLYPSDDILDEYDIEMVKFVKEKTDTDDLLYIPLEYFNRTTLFNSLTEQDYFRIANRYTEINRKFMNDEKLSLKEAYLYKFISKYASKISSLHGESKLSGIFTFELRRYLDKNLNTIDKVKASAIENTDVAKLKKAYEAISENRPIINTEVKPFEPEARDIFETVTFAKKIMEVYEKYGYWEAFKKAPFNTILAKGGLCDGLFEYLKDQPEKYNALVDELGELLYGDNSPKWELTKHVSSSKTPDKNLYIPNSLKQNYSKMVMLTQADIIVRYLNEGLNTPIDLFTAGSDNIQAIALANYVKLYKQKFEDCVTNDDYYSTMLKTGKSDISIAANIGQGILAEGVNLSIVLETTLFGNIKNIRIKALAASLLDPLASPHNELYYSFNRTDESAALAIADLVGIKDPKLYIDYALYGKNYVIASPKEVITNINTLLNIADKNGKTVDHLMFVAMVMKVKEAFKAQSIFKAIFHPINTAKEYNEYYKLYKVAKTWYDEKNDFNRKKTRLHNAKIEMHRDYEYRLRYRKNQKLRIAVTSIKKPEATTQTQNQRIGNSETVNKEFKK